MRWKDCLDKRIAKPVSQDEAMIHSLIRTSKDKLETQGMISTTEVTAASKVSLSYDSLRELLEALALKKGFKIYNHECYTCFIKEVLNDSLLGDEFDDVRKLRNSINYYGKKLTAKECDNTVSLIKSIMVRVKKKF